MTWPSANHLIRDDHHTPMFFFWNSLVVWWLYPTSLCFFDRRFACHLTGECRLAGTTTRCQLTVFQTCVWCRAMISPRICLTFDVSSPIPANMTTRTTAATTISWTPRCATASEPCGIRTPRGCGSACGRWGWGRQWKWWVDVKVFLFSFPFCYGKNMEKLMNIKKHERRLMKQCGWIWRER